MKQLFQEFIKRIELLLENTRQTEYVQDAAGSYLKRTYLEHLIHEAKELEKYGEYRIALENTLENLNEVSLSIDEETANLARNALNCGYSGYYAELLNRLTQPKIEKQS